MKLTIYIGDDYKRIRDILEDSDDITCEFPEEGLYPTDILTHMKKLRMNMEYHKHLLLFTLSPYVLGIINNWLYAYNLSKFNHEGINKIIPEELWLNPDDVKAYKVMKGWEEIKDIFDRESGLISNEEMDEADVIINTEYYEMSNFYE